jgi:hypothetical protein
MAISGFLVETDGMTEYSRDLIAAFKQVRCPCPNSALV